MLPIKRNVLLTGFLMSLLYGIVAYVAFYKLGRMPSIAFLALVPLAMGAIPLLFSDVEQVKSYVYLLVIPWFSIFGLFAVLVATLREAALCLVILGLPFYGSAMVGTLIATLIRAVIIRRERRKAAGAALMLLPFVFVGLEERWLIREDQHEVVSSAIVSAPAALVFDRLAEVETIGDREYRPGIFNHLGAPRPIRATVDRRGLGGHRTGVFTQGLVFQEVIEAYDPPRQMTFSVAVDPTTLRPDSTERHALEGGYFRFVDATYTVEPQGEGRVRLVLSSRYVARSSVNAYGVFWANAIIGDFQDRVLAIIGRRCEAPAAAPPTEVAATTR